MLSMTFLKGYQWPFDARKAMDGSSIVDLLVYRETVLRGRRVFLDFRSNPVREQLDVSELILEAREYLERAGITGGTPIERLRIMNEPAYQFYLERNPYVDLEHDMLEIDLCAQHNNGGLLVDEWWRSNVRGFYPVGEAGGAHGVYRPGGAALNSGQVGATRAAQMIALGQGHEHPGTEPFIDAASRRIREAGALLAAATTRARDGEEDNTGDLLRSIQATMSAKAGPIRSAQSISDALTEISELHHTYADRVAADGSSRRSVDRLFLIRDILTTSYVYLSAMQDYVEHGGRSRGSVIYTDPDGQAPKVGFGDSPDVELDLPDEFRFVLDGGALDETIQEIEYQATGPGTAVVGTWRPRRPIPEDDDFFENVWRDFREHGPAR
jgi:succinate dehydrogenase / fumarate reductase, flavoprotein subunit